MTARKAANQVIRISRGHNLTLGGVHLRCLHPGKGYETEDRNDLSLVLALSYRSFDMLFTGDLGEEGEKCLAAYLKGKTLKSRADNGEHRKKGDLYGKLPDITGDLEVLKVAHHGSRYSTGENFLSLYPRIRAAMISAGRKNRYGHPHPDLLLRLKRKQITAYTTPEKGALSLQTDGLHFRIKGYKGI